MPFGLAKMFAFLSILTGMFQRDPAMRGQDPHQGGGHVGVAKYGRMRGQRATKKLDRPVSKIERRSRKHQSIRDRKLRYRTP